jgi:hypothetical protein
MRYSVRAISMIEQTCAELHIYLDEIEGNSP